MKGKLLLEKVRRERLRIFAPQNINIDSNVMYDFYPNPNQSSVIIRSKEWCQSKFDLSIIVPVYNQEKYIEKCLESVLHQDTDYSYEIVVVNDGSTDLTNEILKKYSESINLIEQTNKGFSGTRNTGIRESSGKYITFLDSDDCLAKGAIQNLMKTVMENDADVVEGNYVETYTDGRTDSRGYKWHDKLEKISSPMETLRGYPWARIYKRTLFEKVQFPENYWYEDTICKMMLEPQMENCYVISDLVYEYLINPNGITSSSMNKAKALDSLYITSQLLNDRKKINMPLTKEDYYFFMKQVKMNYYRTMNLPEKLEEQFF